VSNIFAPNYTAVVTRPDQVDDLIEEWAEQRPELADRLEAMAVFGRLGRLSHHANRSIEAVFREFGLQTGEFDVLAALRRSGSPFTLTPTVLARRLMLSPAGVTDRLNRLEAAGLVTRAPDPQDRRGSLVSLTPGGRQRVDAAVEAHLQNEEQLLGALSDRDRTVLDRLLRRLLASFESSEPQPPPAKTPPQR
jgi:DNA-binding MarR family transcriptional regulator